MHVAGERCSRYDFALIIARCLNVNSDLIVATKMSEVRLKAKRPRDSSLSTERTRGVYGINIPKLEECVREFVKECKESVVGVS
ncbi:MAG: hypothetical protein DRP01_09215 [Archaeoglobales archaeon]|nr:MAG: hypothetical protein DRP01_09215 [Archaeoglobales archaeon]